MMHGRVKSSVLQISLFVSSCVWIANAQEQTNSPAFSPVPISNAPTKALQIVGSNLFVAAWGHGVQVLDISNPASPKWKGSWNPRQCSMGIHVVGNYAYVANRTTGLTVLDVQNAANPIQIGNVKIPGDAMAVNVSGRYAYVADYPTGFQIVDVKDPKNPVLLGAGSLPQAANSIHAVGDYAFFTEPNAFHVFDVRDPLNPVRVIERRISGQVFPRIQLVEYRAFVSSGKLLVFDLTDPAHPQILDRLMRDTNNLPLVVQGTTGFTQIGYTWMLTNAGLRASIEKRHPNMPKDMNEIVEALRNSPFYADVVVRQAQMPAIYNLHVTDRCVLALGEGGLQVIDVSDVERPKRIGECNLSGQLWDVRGAGDYAYVMGPGANIQVVSLEDPTQPLKVGEFSSSRYASAVLIAKSPDETTTSFGAATYADVPVDKNIPELIEPQHLENEGFSFVLIGLPNGAYLIQTSTDLISWSPVSTNIVPESGTLKIVDPHVSSESHRFYRAIRQ